MGSVRRLQFTDRKTGKKKKTPKWYACYTDAEGVQRRVPGYTDRAATLQLLARLEKEAAEVREGVRTPGAADRTRKLTELLELYERRQRDLGLSDGHRRNCSAYIPEVIAGCEWATLADVTADELIGWGARKRGEGGKGCSPSTVNGYLSAVRAFSRWASDRCGCPDPLARKVPKLNEEVDQRRSRRIPTPSELLALCSAAERCPRRRGQKGYMVSGPDRGMLYRVAAYTGFRASELASLTPDSFAYAGPNPTAVTVLAADSKGGRTESVPIPAHLAAVLGPWLAARPADTPLWPGDWADNRGQWNWLRRDCRRAGIGSFPFHAFRSFYVTSLIMSGVAVQVVQKLARHRDIRTTLNSYARTLPADLTDAVGKLPPPVADG